MSYATSLADLMLSAGNAQAESLRQGGQIWGGLAQQLGQVPGQVIQADRQAKEAAQQKADQEQQRQMRSAQLADYQAQAQARQRGVNDDAALDAAMKESSDPQTVIQNLNAAGNGHLVPAYQKTLVEADERKARVATAQQQLQTAQAQQQEAQQKIQIGQADYFGGLAKSVADNFNYAPAAFHTAVATAASHGMMDNVTAGRLIANAIQNPDSIKQNVDAAIAASPEQQKNAAELAKVTAKPAGPITEAELDSQAQALLTKQNQGQALTPVEAASLKAYQDRKRTVSDPAAVNAANRQTDTIAAETARQVASENFAKQQAGRAELTNKVEQPYQDALEKASTLRSVIDAAKNGNMTAAGVQSLLGTLGLVTTEGVKRINSTELQQFAGAGSLLERIKGEAGSLVAGQKLSPKLQDDLAQLSDLLQKSARSKYEQGFGTTTKRYGLTDEQMMADPSAASAAGTTKIGRFDVQVGP